MGTVLDVGGQAVVEGVMMKSIHYISIAVRKADGTIITKLEKIRKARYNKVPIIRGFITLLYIMILGMRALIWSSNQAVDEEEQLSSTALISTVIFSLMLAMGLFVALPYIATTFLGINETVQPIFFNIIDGIIKIVFFIIYILAITLMPDVKRLFEYHGAEHKAVNCYEANLPLTVENAQTCTTIHPRCGTTFIVVTFVISILIFSLVPAVVFRVYPAILTVGFFTQRLILFAVRLAFLPLVSGVSYELLKWAAVRYSNPIVKTIMTPGFWFQKLTTKEPDNQQVEVALHSLMAVLKSEGTLDQTYL